MQAYLALDAYPEVADTLRRLRQGGLRIALLSNGEPGMLAAGAKSAGIDDMLDAILSVEEVGVFKPHPRVYQLAVDRFAVRPDQIAFQSANAWDVSGAATFGLRAVWSTGSACRRSACPVWRSTSSGFCRDCLPCSACERTERRARQPACERG